MDRKRQRELALAGTAVLLLAIATWGMQRGAAPPSGANAPATTAARPNPQPSPNSAVVDVDLQSLEAERPEPGESTRNPFRFKAKPAPPPPPEAIRQREQQAAAAAAAAQATSSPVDPPPPRSPLQYHGDMTDPKNSGKRIAILSDTRGTYYGREGEVIEGRYRILKIGVESIELAYLDGRGRQTIRQTGQ